MVLVCKEFDTLKDAQSTLFGHKNSLSSPSKQPSASIEDDMVALFQPPAIVDDDTNDSISSMLNGVEARFLNAGFVTKPGTTDADMVQRFSKTAMEQNPTNVREYFQTVVENVVSDSVHCCTPTMIGHMTTALPSYMRPLSKLITTIHANNVKTETGKAQTFMEREALAMLHREIFHLGDAFYDEQAHNPSAVLGVVCSGGTIANNSALWIARNNCMPPDPDGGFLGIDKQGLMRGLRHYKYEGLKSSG
jgi:glutamate decarboxylase